ncbi:hypothetical protein HPB50_012112 [Hyalomma asiaticum]|uniref:Uncharacterized protein n=1 Tax=Hyalomma asiaticum TaxID=266040 RepID=A0ACB7RZR6_HYAAI|nr:hypothetical protein HPB50_012112 [Hyalomma asiaticum]
MPRLPKELFPRWRCSGRVGKRRLLPVLLGPPATRVPHWQATRAPCTRTPGEGKRGWRGGERRPDTCPQPGFIRESRTRPSGRAARAPSLPCAVGRPPERC